MANIDEQMLEQTTEEKEASIKRHMLEGNTLFAKGEFEDAVTEFSKAAQYADNVHGELHAECFEPYFQYGKSLLEIARLEADNPKLDFDNLKTYLDKQCAERKTKLNPQGDDASPMANPADDSRVGHAEDVPETERAEIAEKVAEALEENAAELEEIAAAKEEEAEAGSEETNGEKKEDTETADEKKESAEVTDDKKESAEPSVDDKKETNEPTDEKEPEVPANDKTPAENMDVDATVEDGDDESPEAGSPESEDFEDEGSATRAAWEILEVARCICNRQEQTPEWQMKKAKVLNALGSLLIIDENFKEAIDDLSGAIELMKANLPKTDRTIASVYVEIADAYKLLSQFEKAYENYDHAKKILEERLDELKEDKEVDSGTPASDVQEREELQTFIKDLTDAIEDCKSSEKEAAKKESTTATEDATKPSPTKSDTENATPINDLTSAVRKVTKRPPPTEEEEAGEASKKQKVDEAPAQVTPISSNAGQV